MARKLRALAAGGVVVALTGAMTGCWYQPGHGPDRTAFDDLETTIGVGNVDELTERWSAATDGTGVGDPVVSNRGVHVVDSAESWYAFDTGTGERLWTHHVENPGIPLVIGPAISDGNRVLVTSGIGNLGGHYTSSWLDAATGADLGAGEASALVDALRGTRSAWRHVGFGSGTPVATSLILRDSADPGFGWSRPIFVSSGIGGPAAPPVTLGEHGVYQAGTGFLLAGGATPSTGNGVRAWPLTDPPSCVPQAPTVACPSWSLAIGGTSATPPVLGPGEAVLYTVDDLGTVYAVTTADGRLQWTATLGSTSTGAPALANGVLYVPTAAGVVAVDADGCGAASCSPLWRAAHPDGAGARRQPAVANGVLYSAGNDDALRAFDAAGCGAAVCDPLWSADVGSGITGAPAVSNGQLYVGTQDGRVVAYGLG
ncbi:MAG TPA: PQQ-binding-like beta-propeller repeat protein [Acidimicrobiales bacterium]